MPPKITIDTKPYMPRCACATVKCVKCVTALSERSASNEPCTDASVYMMAPNTMKRSVAEWRSAPKCPLSVRCWFTENAVTGMIIITLCTIDSVISHGGIGPPIRWCAPTWP